MFKKGSRIIIYIGLGMLIAVLYLRQNTQTRIVEKIERDTTFITEVDTLHVNHYITKYKPTPKQIEYVYVDSTKHERKVYEFDSTYVDSTSAKLDYHIYTRTDNNDLDSISLKFKMDYPKITEYKTITNTITKYKKNRFNYGLQTGIGYGLLNRNVDFYVGFGFEYNF